MDDLFGSALAFAMNPGGFIENELFGSTATKNAPIAAGGAGGGLADALSHGGGGGGGGAGIALGEMSGDLISGGGHSGGAGLALGGLAALGPGAAWSSSSHGGGNLGDLAAPAITTGSQWKSR
jgi:hypothetical protein